MKKIKILAALFIFLSISACNPYKGFKGVSKKGMSTRKAPSQQLKDDMSKSEKKLKKRYDKDMKRKKKKYGHSIGE